MKNSDRSHYRTAKVLPLAILALLAVGALGLIFSLLQKSAGWDTLIRKGFSSGGAITFDSSGRAWFKANDTLKSYDTQTQTFHDTGLASRGAYAIAFDPEGNPWVGGWGLYVFDGETWTTYTIDNSKLIHNSVRSIAFDREGKAWIGTGGGIQVIDGETWSTRTEDSSGNDYEDGGIHEIAIDPSGRVWIGSSYGVDVFDGESWVTYNTGNSDLIDDTVSAIAFDSEGKAWIGTSGGLSIIDGESWTAYTRFNSDLITDHVSQIAIDPAGRVWLGTYSGISVFDGETWTTFTKDNSGLPDNRIREITIDPSGRAWIGVQVSRQGTHALVLAPIDEHLTNPNLAPEPLISFQYYFFSVASIWLTSIGLAILCFAFALKIKKAYMGVIGWLLSLPFFIRAGDIWRGTPRLELENHWVRSFYIITTLGAIGSILAGILTKSSEKREQMISLGFWLGIGLGIGISVLLTLIFTFLS